MLIKLFLLEDTLSIIYEELQKLTNILKNTKFAKTIDFKDIKVPVKLRGIHKTEKKSFAISVSGYKNKEKFPYRY